MLSALPASRLRGGAWSDVLAAAPAASRSTPQRRTRRLRGQSKGGAGRERGAGCAESTPFPPRATLAGRSDVFSRGYAPPQNRARGGPASTLLQAVRAERCEPQPRRTEVTATEPGQVDGPRLRPRRGCRHGRVCRARRTEVAARPAVELAGRVVPRLRRSRGAAADRRRSPRTVGAGGLRASWGWWRRR